MVNAPAHLSFTHSHAPRAGNNGILLFFFFFFLFLFLQPGKKLQIVFLKADYQAEQGASTHLKQAAQGTAWHLLEQNIYSLLKVQPVIP